MTLDVTTDYDHYLTCVFTRIFKTNRLTSLTLKLDKLHTPPFLQDTIVHEINQCYNNGLVNELQEYYHISFNHNERIKCTHLPYRIG